MRISVSSTGCDFYLVNVWPKVETPPNGRGMATHQGRYCWGRKTWKGPWDPFPSNKTKQSKQTETKKSSHLNILYPSRPSLREGDPESMFSCWGWWHLDLWVLSSLNNITFSLKVQWSAVWRRRGDNLMGSFEKVQTPPGFSFAHLDKDLSESLDKAIKHHCLLLWTSFSSISRSGEMVRSVSVGKREIHWPHVQRLSFSPNR